MRNEILHGLRAPAFTQLRESASACRVSLGVEEKKV